MQKTEWKISVCCTNNDDYNDNYYYDFNDDYDHYNEKSRYYSR